MPPISVVAIATADRPERLRRALAALTTAALPREPALRFVIVDGSRSRTNRIATRACLERAAADAGRAMQYIGPAEARGFRRSLGVSGPLIRALSPGTIGANRNLLILLTAGEHVLFIDDDIVAETRALASRAPGLVLVGHDEHREFRFVASRRAALAAVQSAYVPLIAAHEALLGRTLPELVAASSDRVSVSQPCGHLLSGLGGRRRLAVRLTFAGLVGDSATYCPHRLLLTGPGTLLRSFWSSERTFKMAMRSRDVVRLAATNYVTHNANCMAGCMGLANDRMAPPFPPAGANEDGVFGALLAAIDRQAVYGHLSVGVFHDSGRRSGYRSDEARSARESRLSELIINLVRRSTASGGSRSPKRRLTDIGRALHDLSTLPPGEFVAYVTAITRETRTREFDFAETIAGEPDCPAYWRRALARYRRTWERSSRSKAFFLPVEFHHPHQSVESGFREAKEFLRRFADLATAWPELWRKARDANEHRARHQRARPSDGES